MSTRSHAFAVVGVVVARHEIRLRCNGVVARVPDLLDVVFEVVFHQGIEGEPPVRPHAGCAEEDLVREPVAARMERGHV